MTLHVWTYWEGPRTPFIETCLRSMEWACNVPEVEFHLVTPENLGEFLPRGVMHPHTRRMKVPSKTADCIRAGLLLTHGGWWWDADTIGMRSPLHLTLNHPAATSLYSAWTRPPRRILNGYIYMQKGCNEAHEWVDRINHKVKYDFHLANVWGHLGEILLTPIITSGRYPNATEIPLKTYLPIYIDASPTCPYDGADSTVETFFEPGDFRDYLTDTTVAYGMNHSYFEYWHPEEMAVGPAEWAESPLLLHQLLDYAHTR